ncbi:hypothetical protein GCM10007276_11930 [Agaricicola taiwanensis]|uniref:Tyr recombinase domain-containing protein n=1 Tax=Agaricicola taiwanensis TaxID=591372 RepID=A0A8J2YGL8_9RHOB|nr:site-specific integrase [Agaricicola taiwanensis]GGE36072.1 hypothetical protein GCM10007276_11930 [Agaricicola taiwanensis]
MPRQRVTKGPRLWLQPERRHKNGSIERAVYVVLDDGIKRSTGCGPDRRGEAEEALARYIAEKRLKDRPRDRSASEVMMADVLAIYASDVAPNHARPHETGARIGELLKWWGDKRLSDVTRSTCQQYAAHRGNSSARRELEDMRAAITYHRREGLCREVVEVTLPRKAEARRNWLTRSEVAKLLWTAWRYKEVQQGAATRRYRRRHVARFILIALYTGTRPGAVCRSSFDSALDNFGWIDIERRLFYRRPVAATETNKRRPPVPLPDRLMAHLRRWERMGMIHPVDFNGEPVREVKIAFRRNAQDAKVKATPHTLRHTAATWLMQAGTDPWEAAGYLGMSLETLLQTYGHHHPDYMAGAKRNLSHRKDTEKMGGTKREHAESNVTKIAHYGGKR